MAEHILRGPLSPGLRPAPTAVGPPQRAAACVGGAEQQLQKQLSNVRDAKGSPVHSQPLTLADFFTVSALLSLLEVLAALGELRPLERMSSLMGEVRPSGLAGCFLRPLRSVDICPSRLGTGEDPAPCGPHQS